MRTSLTREQLRIYLADQGSTADRKEYASGSEDEIPCFRKDTFALKIPPNLIEEACLKYQISKNTLFQGSFAYLLCAYSYSEEVCVTFPASLPSHKVPYAPFLIKVDQRMSVQGYLSSIQRQTEGVRGPRTVSLFDLKIETGRNPARILFTFEERITPQATEGNMLGQQSDMTVDIIQMADEFKIVAGYAEGKQATHWVQNFVSYYNTVLAGLITKENLLDIQILTEEQQQQMIQVSRGRTMEMDTSRTVANLISAYAAKTPDALAVDDDTETLTYSEMERRANILARRLIQLGVKQGDFVGILLERSIAIPVSTLAIFKAGAAYLPLDSEYPANRLRYMAEDSEIPVLITTRNLFSRSVSWTANCQCLYLDETDFSGEAIPIDLSMPDGNAYMIYTSGSTGVPKGVVLHHAGLVNLCAGLQEILELTPEHRFASHSSISFDAHVDAFYPILTCGGSLHIMPESIRKDFKGMVSFLKEHRIDGVDMTTSLGKLLERRSDLDLKYITIGGEKLSGVVSKKITFINVYGPTESTDIVCSFRLEQGKKYDDIPIGMPLPNLWCFVLDRFGHMLPPEMDGELCVAGIQVGNGYWQLPENTARTFEACPFVQEDHFGRKVRMYHTGDLAWREENGLLHCAGRIDSQVKLNGYRVELGEIEQRALETDGIKDVAARVIQYAGGDHLVLYYAVKEGMEISGGQLKEILSRTSLPDFMIPDRYMRMDELPRTPNGKIDRNNLPIPETGTADEIVLPCTFKEITLWGILKEILGTDQFGINTDLISMGLTSMDTLVLFARAEEQGIKLKVTDVAKHRTIQGILEHNETICYWVDESYVPDKPVLVFAYGIDPFYHINPLVTELSKSFSVLAIEPVLDHYADVLQGQTTQNAVDLYLELINRKIPEGVPIFGFMGHSYGGELAYRMAVQWSQKHNEKPHVYLMDTDIHQIDGKDYDQYVNATVEKLKDNPQALKVYQTIRVITDLPRKMGDGKPFPAYDGPVVYFCATHITADFDYFRNEVLEVKTDDHPSVISWKGLNPKTEFVYIPDTHRQLWNVRWIPLYMEYLRRDIEKTDNGD